VRGYAHPPWRYVDASLKVDGWWSERGWKPRLRFSVIDRWLVRTIG
jgi:hypothetical protein